MDVSERIASLAPEKRALLERLLQKKRGEVAIPKPLLRRSGVGPTPLSFAQQRLWFLDQLEPNSYLFNMPVAVVFKGSLNIEALEQTFSEMVRRHESLRTTIAVQGDQPFQVIGDPAPVPIPIVDLTHLPQETREAEAKKLAQAEAQRPFNLRTGPLLRVSVVKLDDDEHVLMLTLHHIVSDGWSMRVLIDEVAEFYGAFTAGRAAQLPELPLQYADYAAWQRDWLQGAVLEGELAYWRRQLVQAPATLELPTDGPRQVARTFNGGTLRLILPLELSQALKELSKKNGATLFMTLLAAYQVLLHRYTGQHNIVVGTPIAGRNRPEIEGIIGFFLNSLALNTDLSGNPSFREALERVREVTLGAYTHQNLPFEKILEELHPERTSSRSPVFEVFFNMLNFAPGGVALSGLRARYLCQPDIGTKFDLTLYAEDQRGGISLLLVYNSDLFSRERMSELLRQYEYLLQQVAENPEAAIGNLSLVTPEARAFLPDPTASLSDKWEGAVHEIFSAQAQRDPQRIAICDSQTTWTYGELETRTNQLANYLIANGIAPGERVAIYAHRSASLIWALLGILKAGAAFVIIDPAHPVSRQKQFLQISAARFLLQIEAAGSLPDELALLTDRRLVIPTLTETGKGRFLEEYATEISPPALGPDSLAYIAFTSGTTDKPKGIRGRHGSLSHFQPWWKEQFGLSEKDRFSVLSGLSHDPLQRDLFIPLQLGACICIPSPEMMAEPGWLAAWMKSSDVTFANLTPAMSRLLCETAVDDLPSLRHVFYIGDALTRQNVAALRRLAPEANCVNLYGTTETQRALSYFIVPRDEPENCAREIVPLGRGLPDVQLLVLNAMDQLAGVGEVGEICVRSPHVALGYVDDRELTNGRFIVNPFLGNERDRIYRTGDLGRYLPNGDVEPLGRADFQVKIRGFRVELAECESVLTQHPDVREVVVVARADESDEKRLVAYVTLKLERSWEPASLRDFTSRRLPDYMTPAAFVQLDAIPLTPNGKVDRAALPAPDYTQLRTASGAPRTPTEEMLAGIWAQLLRVNQVGVEDNFFDLGGHSLLATQVVSRARKAFHTELPLRTLFESPTLQGMARCIEEAQARGAGISAGPIEPVPRDRPLPLSFAQQRLWFLDQLEPANAAYNMPVAVRLSGRLDFSALEKSLREIVRRHESLRTTFVLSEEMPVQLIAENLPVALAQIDLSLLSETDREQEVRKRAKEEAQRPFDLMAGPLWRTALLRLAAEEHVFLFTVHHIVSDGWSMGVIVEEVATHYKAFIAGEDSPLAELPVQYADYAAWQREWLAGERLEQQLTYWTEKLTGVPALLELPADRPRPVVQSFNGAVESMVLSESATVALKLFSQREQVTLFMTLVAAFQTLLHRYSGQHDIVVGTPIANRTRLETESLIGCFANTLALRSTFATEMTFGQLLREVRETTLGAYQHQEVPFERIVEELQPERSLSHSPVFQVLMSLLDGTLSDAQLPGLVMSSIGAERTAVRFDLVLNAADTGSGLAFSLEYNTDLFEQETAKRMLSHLVRLLDQLPEAADARISNLSLLTAAEEKQLLSDYNDSAINYPSTRAHEMFAKQAAETPAAVAVSCGDQELSYCELNRRANRLAHYLIAQGVRPGVLVGLLLERSAELLVALLGVLKAGGTYLPLDPHFPRERLTRTIVDADLEFVLTDARLGDLVPAATMRVIRLVDHEAPEIARQSDENPAVFVFPESPAYVIYTSGSTGRPKGIAVSHRSLTNFLCSMQVTPGLTAVDRVLAVTTLSFDIAVLELLLPLTAGATTIVVTRDEATDPAFLAKALAGGVTVFQATPATWRLLIDNGWAGQSNLKALIGGEALSPALMRELLPRVDQLWNMYGPTETTIWSTVWHIPPAADRVSIGGPIANTQTYVLDSNLRPAPWGIAGELYIGGAGLALGYRNRAALTALNFIPDPFSPSAGSRLYRTGDVVRRRAGGELEYLGRNDVQVKIRGFRIELGDVEAALLEYPAVAQAVVLARAWGTDAGLRLVAYVVCVAGAPVDVAELRAHLRGVLPDYMTPAGFVLLDSLPLTPNGKIDRQALPDPGMDQEARASIQDATPFVELVCEIWRELLGVENVSAGSNFFELGGHSLSATQMLSRVRQSFNVELPLRTLFASPTVQQLSEKIHAAISSEGGTPAPAITRLSRDEALPLSFAQQRLWFLDQLAPGTSGYNIFAAVRLIGDLNVLALQQTLTEIISRHETLRTSMPAVAGQPLQVLEPPYEAELSVTNLTKWADVEDRERECRRLAQAEAQRPFNLAQGRLLRTALVKIGAEEHVMFLTMHHIISDAWSLGVLVREVVALYPAFSAHESSPLPALPIQYVDYASWQRNWLTGEVLERQLSFWRQQLEGAPPLLALPADYVRPAVQSFRGASRSRALPAALTQAIRRFSRREGSTLFMTLLAAFQSLLHRYSGVEDILVSTGIANRSRAETEKLIGFFINTILLRADFSDGPTFRELLQQVRETTLAAHAHQDLPFEKLVEALQPARDAAYSPLAQVMFVLQNMAQEQAELPGLQVRPFGSEVVSTKFDLIMWVEEGMEQLTVALQYSTDLFAPATIDQLLEYYEGLLRSVVDQPDEPVASIAF